MPWIELVADISGVCSVAGTFPMTSMPTSSASTKMVRSVTRAVDTGASWGGVWERHCWLEQAGHDVVDDPAVMRDHHAGLDLVPGQVQQHRGDVPRVRVRGRGGHGGGQVLGAYDRDPVTGHDRLAGNRAG